MFLATPTVMAAPTLVFGAIGIALVAGAAAAANCLLEQKIDARMARTRARARSRAAPMLHKVASASLDPSPFRR